MSPLCYRAITSDVSYSVTRLTAKLRRPNSAKFRVTGIETLWKAATRCGSLGTLVIRHTTLGNKEQRLNGAYDLTVAEFPTAVPRTGCLKKAMGQVVRLIFVKLDG